MSNLIVREIFRADFSNLYPGYFSADATGYVPAIPAVDGRI
jgi:hypothetical protein